MEKHLIIISLDAMVYEDLEYASSLPNFKRFLDGSLIKRVTTIYPSLTHPVHASLLTGTPAGETGVYSNIRFDPYGKPNLWLNNLSDVSGDTILHAAKRAGLTTAVASWPLTAGKGDVIDYLLPSVFNYELEGRENDPIAVFLERGLTENLKDILEEAITKYDYHDKHPSIDDLQTFVCTRIIKEYKPNLLMTHLSYIDSMRHWYGVFSDKIPTAIEACDRWLGEIYDAVCDAGLLDSTDFIILSDHGHVNYDRIIKPNIRFVEEGLIRLDNEGKLIDYDAMFAYAGMTTYVYLSNPSDKALYDKVYAILLDMKEDGRYGFGEVMTSEFLRSRYGLYGGFSFAICGDTGAYFNQGLTGELVTEAVPLLVGYGHSSHGHLPELGPQPIFIGYGPGFKRGERVETCSILSHAPTAASILGLNLKCAKLQPVYQILK